MFAFVVINIFTVAYAALQGTLVPSWLSLLFVVYQFRGFGGSCPVITTVGWLALINVWKNDDVLQCMIACFRSLWLLY